jgi:hypothetical protein
VSGVRRLRRFFLHEVQALELPRVMMLFFIMATRENEFELKLGRIGHERPGRARLRAGVRQASVIGGPKARVAPKTGMRGARSSRRDVPRASDQ